MRVLLISHTCQSRTEGQPKAYHLARLPGVELRVLVPDRWRHYGAWRSAQPPAAGDFDCTIGKVAWPWAGPAQFYLHWYPGLGRMMEEFRPDVIDLWEEPWGLVSAHACWLRGQVLPGARVVSETEQNIAKRLPFPFERMRSFTLEHADFAVGRSTEAVEVLRARGYAGRAEVVPNAVDAELFRPLEAAEREAARGELGMPGFVAGYVGRLIDSKGLTDLVDALPLCPNETRLLFVGDGPLRGTLERQAAALGMTPRVRFLPARPLTELPRVMGALDALVLPSRTTRSWKEQFGRVIIEAHACGVPVIGSGSGAIPEVVGQGGLIVPERDPAALAGAVRRLVSDSALGRALGAAGRRQVEEQYTWQRVAERMSLIYAAVTAQPRRKAV